MCTILGLFILFRWWAVNGPRLFGKQSQAIIDPTAKRHLNGVSLVGPLIACFDSLVYHHGKSEV